MRRIVQMFEHEICHYALCDDGTLWMLEDDRTEDGKDVFRWIRMPDVPQGNERDDGTSTLRPGRSRKNFQVRDFLIDVLAQQELNRHELADRLADVAKIDRTAALERVSPVLSRYQEIFVPQGHGKWGLAPNFKSVRAIDGEAK